MNTYQTTIQTWDKVAQLYQDNFMNLELYNDTYDVFCNAIQKQEAEVFEIGCGPGNITKYILSKRPGFIINATDVAPNMVALAKQNNPAAHFSVLDAREIHTVANKFDGIMCGFCIPYLSKEDVTKLIQNAYDLLHEQGVLYCSAIEGSYNQSGYETSSTGDKVYVYYYEQNYLEQLLIKNGFTNIQTFRKQYNKKDGTPQIHLIILAHKNSSV